MAAKGTTEAGNNNTSASQRVNVNFHVTKLANPDKKLHALCLVIQPIIVAKNNQN